MTIVIEKVWDENERVHESRNGRTYVNHGRWQWLVIMNGETDSAHDRKRDAVARVAALNDASRIMVDYRLPDGRIVRVDDTAAKGAAVIAFEMAREPGGPRVFVDAVRVRR